jgi:hypothetical protein
MKSATYTGFGSGLQRAPRLFVLLLSLIVASWAQAASISGVAIAQVSSELDPANSPFIWDEQATYVIDGSGLDAAGLHGSNSFGRMWAANTFVPSQTNGPTDTSPFIVFDLGAVYSLSSFRIWNYNGVDAFHNYSGRSIRDADISTSLNGVSFSDAGSYVLLPAPGANGYAGELIPFDVTARFVRFDIRTNHAGDLAYGVGMSEISFSSVPAPPSIVLFGSALVGGAGALRKRHRKQRAIEGQPETFSGAPRRG